MNYLDIIVIVILVISAILGFKRGFIKQLMFHTCTILQLVGGVAAAYFLAPYILNAENIGAPILQLTSSWFAGETFAQTFATQAELANALTQLSIPSFFATPLSAVFILLPTTANTLGGAFGYIIALVVLYIALFIAGYWLAKLLCRSIEKLLLLVTKSKFIKFIDRILGVAFSLAFTYCIFSLILGGIGIIPENILPEVTSAIHKQISLSPILSTLYTTNPIGDFIASLFGLKILTLSI